MLLSVLAAAKGLRYNPWIMGHETAGRPGEYPRRSGRLWMLLVLPAALALRLVALDRQDIWWDEARNIDVALRPFWQVAVAPELDIHPPIYFWLLHGWLRVAGVTMGMEAQQIAWLARWLSVAAGVIGVALLYRLGARLVGSASHAPRAGVLAALLGAGAAFWLAESQETRMYTVGFALLAGAAVAWMEMLPRQERDGGSRWCMPGAGMPRAPVVLFVLLSAAALLTHYNAVFVVVAWYIAWAAMALPAMWRGEARGAVLRPIMLCGLGTAVLVAPIAPIALRQIPGYANPNLAVPGLGEYLRQNWQAYWAGYAYDRAWGGGAGEWWLWGAGGIAGLALVVLAVRRFSPATVWGMAWLVGATALYYVAVMDRGAFNVRYASFVTPALYALVGAGLVELMRIRRALVAAIPAALLFWPHAVQADLWDTRFDREDMSGVAAWLRHEAGPRDVIFVDQKYPFGFYYQRYTVDAEAEPVGPERAPARYLFVDINTLDQVLTRWAGEAETVYWVQWFESDTDPRRAVSFLLDQAGTRGEERLFRGYTVDRWALRPPNRFVLGENLQPQLVVFSQFQVGPAVQTLEIGIAVAEVAPGGYVPVVIRWQRVPGARVEVPLKARVALYDRTGARIAQRDERLLNDRHLLPSHWQADDRPLNVYLLEVPAETESGPLEVGLLVYHVETLEPLDVLDAAGNPAGIEAIIGTVQAGASDSSTTAIPSPEATPRP